MKFFQALLGLVVFVLLTVYQWLPFFGVLSIIGGVVGFFTGSDMAGRSFLLGIILLAIRYVIAFFFSRLLIGKSSSSSPSSFPIENANDDRWQHASEKKSAVEQITNREAFIRALLSRSSYCHTFTQDECSILIASYELSPDDLPSIVDELNRRRAQMDSQERAFYHADKNR